MARWWFYMFSKTPKTKGKWSSDDLPIFSQSDGDYPPPMQQRDLPLNLEQWRDSEATPPVVRSISTCSDTFCLA